MFEDRILPITEDIMLTWRLLVEEGREGGHTFAQPDLMIAATALHHGLTVVSRNTSDFERVKVPEPMDNDASSRRTVSASRQTAPCQAG
jgi:toxin FitB